MEKRTRQWHRRQAARVFKARMKFHASITGLYTSNEGIETYRPLWSDLAKEHWAQVYRTTGTPCSCWMCQGESYNRLEAKREMRRILKEEELQKGNGDHLNIRDASISQAFVFYYIRALHCFACLIFVLL